MELRDRQVFPANIYSFENNNKALEKDAKYVQS